MANPESHEPITSKEIPYIRHVWDEIGDELRSMEPEEADERVLKIARQMLHADNMAAALKISNIEAGLIEPTPIPFIDQGGSNGQA